STNGVLFNANRASLIQFPAGVTGNYTVPNGVTNVAYGAFHYARNLGKVTFPATVIGIGDFAFYGCTILQGLYFYGNAPTLGGSSVFQALNHPTAYYQTGTTGWSSTYGGLSTAVWKPPPYTYA